MVYRERVQERCIGCRIPTLLHPAPTATPRTTPSPSATPRFPLFYGHLPRFPLFYGHLPREAGGSEVEKRVSEVGNGSKVRNPD